MPAARKTTPTAAEALAEKVPFTYNGVDYQLEPTSEWSYEVLEAFEDGRLSSFLRGVLGDEQHEKFKATKPRVKDLEGFVLGLQGALGISGN